MIYLFKSWNSFVLYSSGCGGIIHADFGSIKSPNYPQNFPSNTECSWTIIAHEGNHLEMGFASEFQIPDTSGHCQSSYIKVTIWKIFMQTLHLHKWMLVTCHESFGFHVFVFFLLISKVWAGDKQQNDALLATGCGSTAPPPIIAPFNVITARFQSTETPGKGFSSSFSTSIFFIFLSTEHTIIFPICM